MSAEALGTDRAAAEARARELNTQGDQLREAARMGSNSNRPGTVARLFTEYQASDEFAELKQRTRDSYTYEMGWIEKDLGGGMVRALSPKALKTYYKRLVKERSITVAYHRLAVFRAVLSWAVSEDWIKQNPALDVRVKMPKKRDVVWTLDQMETYLAQAAADGWHSIVAMVHVFDSIGQSPIDVRTLPRKAYAGGRISVARQKTGVKGAPIPLFPDAVAALDAYLSTQPAALPDAPLFRCETTGEMWGTSHLQHTHAKIRKAAGLPKELQLQDFRTSAATEGGAAGGTVDELRGLQRHSSRTAGEHYVHPDARFVESIQAKRLALRQAKAVGKRD
jgi:site-specific recombinase XerC